MERTAQVLEKVLALVGRLQDSELQLQDDSVQLPLPQLPSNMTSEALREYHENVMRGQHQFITDALSGKRLGALDGCVQIAIQGTSTSGQSLRVGNAKELSAWLRGLHDLPAGQPRCALLTAGPAAGKTVRIRFRSPHPHLSH